MTTTNDNPDDNPPTETFSASALTVALIMPTDTPDTVAAAAAARFSEQLDIHVATILVTLQANDGFPVSAIEVRL